MIATSVPAERPVLAGFAKVDITPPLDHIHAFGLGYWYQRSIRFTGVRDPLYARALVLGDRDCQVFVSVDAILDTYGFVPESQRQISQRLGIRPDEVFITCTHTHSAPLIGVNRTNEGAEYGEFLVEHIVESVVQARSRRVPVTAVLQRGPIPGVIRNRRVLLRNGCVAELHVALDPSEIAGSGPVNEILTVVNFHDESGELAGAICHFGIHGVAIQCSDLISSDCMGRAIQNFENDSNNRTVMLHLNAPCGDIDPVAMGDEKALEEMARRLYEGLRDVIATPKRAISLVPQQSVAGLFRAHRRETRATAELARQLERMAPVLTRAELRHHSGCGYERFLLEEEQAVAEMPADFDIPYQILRSGDLLWVGVAGEIFTCSGQRIASLDDRLEILPVGITGGSFGYLPTEEMFSQGGYEVSAARWCRIAPGQAENLFHKVESDIRDMIGAPR